MKNLTRKQVDALELLKRLYPRGAGTTDPEHRAAFDSLVARDSGLVELVDYSDSPSGDCYRLTDEAAEVLREGAREQAESAVQN